MKISDDLDGLREHIAVPQGLTRARWAARPHGTVGLGPTDLELLVLFPLGPAEWNALSTRLGPTGEVTTLHAPTDLVEAVGLQGASPPQGSTLPCTPYANIRWTCEQSIKTGDGLLVYLSSR